MAITEETARQFLYVAVKEHYLAIKEPTEKDAETFLKAAGLTCYGEWHNIVFTLESIRTPDLWKKERMKIEITLDKTPGGI